MAAWLTPEAAGAEIGMSKWWISEQIRKGRIAVTYFGNRPRIRREDFEFFVTNSLPATPRKPREPKIHLVDNKR